MAVLELTREEGQMLEAALHAYEQTLLFEIANADVRAFRAGLRARETVVHALLDRVRLQVLEPAGTS